MVEWQFLSSFHLIWKISCYAYSCVPFCFTRSYRRLVLTSIFRACGFSFDSVLVFSFTVHCCFMAVLKTSAYTNPGQSHRSVTHCIKKLHRYNLKSEIFKHSFLFIHTFKNTTQLLKTFFCKQIAHKCYVLSFNLFHLVQTRVYSC